MSEKLGHCLKCGAPVSLPRTGRLPLYCGRTCRAAAGYELKRLQRRLEGLEEQLSFVRRRDVGAGLGLTATQKRHHEARRAAEVEGLEVEISIAEERLRLLLSEHGTPLADTEQAKYEALIGSK